MIFPGETPALLLPGGLNEIGFLCFQRHRKLCLDLCILQSLLVLCQLVRKSFTSIAKL